MSICECSDKECHAHDGTAFCNQQATVTLWRVDTLDLTGTDFCEDCAADALDSGCFTDEPNEGQECPICGSGTGLPLGRMGSRIHYRCVNCGMEYSEEVQA